MSVFYHRPPLRYPQLYGTNYYTMQRKKFLRSTLLAAPALLLGKLQASGKNLSEAKPFIVNEGQSRFGETVKFLGVHPNDLKISSKDTGGQLSVFEYTGLGKTGPTLHMHFDQDEIFMITEGEYRFVVGDATHVLKAGQTIFLPRQIPHTWIQLSDRGRMIYYLQPAGKMEEFFSLMNTMKERPSQEAMDKIHAAHGMKVMGPPLTL
jgi:quercetin dioxygenase-like cupin family protein